MFPNDLIKNVPDFRALLLHQALRALNRRCGSTRLQLMEDKRLEQFQRHFLGQPALMQAQLRPDDDDRTT